MRKGYFTTINSRIISGGRLFRSGGLIFTPGILLILVGVGFVVAPRLLMALGAVLFITFGALFFFLAYKLVRLKAKLDKFSRNIEARIIVQQGDIQEPFVAEEAHGDTLNDAINGNDTIKKIIYH